MVRHIPCGAFVNESDQTKALDLARREFDTIQHWQKASCMPEQALQDLTRDLCLGIARLEDLPRVAFAPEQLTHGVPLRISPRTPTESAFWVIKPCERFRLAPALPPAADGLERLHTGRQHLLREPC